MAVRTPIIAIVGRPNVGKSTLFNKMIGSRRALVEDEPGVTRDRNYALIDRYSVLFSLIDTGGLEIDPEEEMSRLVTEQAIIAAEEADIIVALFDGKAGLQPGDEDVVAMLRQYKKTILYVVNKCDGLEQAGLASDFYSLGLDNLSNLSALHGRGVREFIEHALAQLPNYSSLLASKRSLEEKQQELVRALELAAIDDEFHIIEEETAATGGSNEESSAAEDLEEYGEEFYGPSEFSAKSDYFVDGDGLESEANSWQEGKKVANAPYARTTAAAETAKRPAKIEPSFAPVFFPSTSSQTETEYERQYKILPLNQSTWVERDEVVNEEEAVFGEDFFVEQQSTLPECIKVAIIGRPNAGKSTLLNTMLGENKVVTSPISGTTRDALYFRIRRDGQDYELIDTAGLRKKARVSNKIERYSTIRALGAIAECDVAVVLIDGTVGPTDQDAKILGLAHDQGKAIVLVVNKWDIVVKDHRTVNEFQKKIREEFKFSPYAPILFVSAMTGKRCPSIIDSVKQVAIEQHKRISTARLNVVLKRAMRRVTAPAYRGLPIKLYYAAQVSTAPPRFVLFFNYPRQVHFSYLRFIKNAIRDEFAFVGTDIKLVCRRRS